MRPWGSGSLAVYHLLVTIEKLLDEGNDTSWATLWATLRAHPSTDQVVTVVLPTSSGAVDPVTG